MWSSSVDVSQTRKTSGVRVYSVHRIYIVSKRVQSLLIGFPGFVAVCCFPSFSFTHSLIHSWLYLSFNSTLGIHAHPYGKPVAPTGALLAALLGNPRVRTHAWASLPISSKRTSSNSLTHMMYLYIHIYIYGMSVSVLYTRVCWVL